MSADALRSLLLHVLAWGALPLWILAGLGDWLCHRWSRIEQRSGQPEAAMHVAQYALTALPVLLGLFFEIDAAVLVLMTVGVAAHTLLAWIDTAYTQPRRYIGTLEQQLHPWLELLPVFALVVIAVLHADAWQSPEWGLQLRVVPLPALVRYGVPLALVPGALLTLEEFLRCTRAAVAVTA